MTPADVARNAKAVANLAARLEAWGLTDPEQRAEHVVMNLAADGYRPLDRPVPLAGPSSTEAGRRRARELFEQTRAAKDTGGRA